MLYVFQPDGTDCIFQGLVRPELDTFQFYFRILPFRLFGDCIRASQSGVEISDPVQMHLFAFCQFVAHRVRQGIEYGAYIRFS